MHDSVMTWIRESISREHIEGKRVLEVGSANINGSARPYIECLMPFVYTGIDLNAGPGVDIVADIEQFSDDYDVPVPFDVIITTEMLEHVKDWKAAVMEMKKLLAVGGLILLTTRSKGFKFHNPPDRWRFNQDILRAAFGDFFIDKLIDDPQTPGVFLMAHKVCAAVAPIPVGVEAFPMEQI